MASALPEEGLLATADALSIKSEGNIKFKAEDYEGARHLYSEALDKLVSVETKYNDVDIRKNTEIYELKATLLNNRGMTHLKMKHLFAAIRDFTNCISLCQMPSTVSKCPSYMRGHQKATIDAERKALYRRSLVYRQIGNYPSAIRDILSIIRILPKDNRKGLNPSVSKVYSDLTELADANHPPPPIQQSEHKIDQRLNCFGAEWKAVCKNRRTMPEGRQGHTATLWNDAIYILGGTGIDNMHVEIFEVFNLKTKEWKTLPLSKKLRNLENHTTVLHKDKLIVYGGDEFDNSNRIWEFCLKQHKWRTLPITGKVPGLVEHSACVLNSTMYVFGGRGDIDGNLVDHSNNFYALDLNTYSWTKISGTDDQNPYTMGVDLPEPRCNHAMWPDNTRKRVYILGGVMEKQCLCECKVDCFETTHAAVEDMWYYDIQQGKWCCQELYGNVPVSRQEFTAVPTSRGAVIFGGFTTCVYTYFLNRRQGTGQDGVLHCAYLNDTFEFVYASDSFCMIQTQGKPLSKRAGCALVIDDQEQLYAVHGYHGNDMRGFSDIHVLNLNKTHHLSPPPTVRNCACCERTTTQEKLKKCNGICEGQAWYCSSVCQKQHWPEHKKICGRRKDSN